MVTANLWIQENVREGELPDGTPLYRVYTWGFNRWIIRSWWNGAEGEQYGGTLDGETYSRPIGSYSYRKWERVTVS